MILRPHSSKNNSTRIPLRRLVLSAMVVLSFVSQTFAQTPLERNMTLAQNEQAFQYTSAQTFTDLAPSQNAGTIDEYLKPGPSVLTELPDNGLNQDQINAIPLEYVDQSISPNDILDDKLNLLPQDFKIAPDFKKRVAFWLDIYTKYSSHFAILHDSDRPWIVYRVVDLRDIYKGKGNRFTKAANDHKAVVQAKTQVRAMLVGLSKKKNFSKLTDEEYKVYKLLEEVPGTRHKVFLKAAHEMRNQRGQKDFFKQGLVFSSRYISEMESIFAKYDLPVELVRLPLVESSFNEDAQSKVGASGIWQFMPSMGRHYLHISQSYDERNSPIKASEAAAKLMVANFKTTHSWPLAITSYNHGAGGVMKAAKLLHTRNINDIVSKYHSHGFGFASQNFFSEFTAALYGERYQEQVFGAMAKYPPLGAESADLRYSMRAKTLSNIVGVTIEELKLYNPDLKAQAIAGSTYLPRGYHLRLPVGHRAGLDLFNKQADDARAEVAKIISPPHRAKAQSI